MENARKWRGSTVIPGLRYRDPDKMMDWLCRAFGFTMQTVYRGPEGAVVHAQLTMGDGMVMLGQVENESAGSGLLRQPDELGGIETQALSLIVEDCDAVYAKASAAGAVMVMDLAEQSYSGKAFSCRDPEGHLWHVGSYNPWALDPA